MCGVACSCLCIVIVRLKQALIFGADVTFIDCTSFSEANTPDVKCASPMKKLICFECTPFGLRHLGASQLSSISAAAWSCGKSFFVSWACCSCDWISSFSSFNALFSMSGAMMLSCSLSRTYSSNHSVPLCSPEIRFLRIQLPEGSLIRSC